MIHEENKEAVWMGLFVSRDMWPKTPATWGNRVAERNTVAWTCGWPERQLRVKIVLGGGNCS